MSVRLVQDVVGQHLLLIPVSAREMLPDRGDIGVIPFVAVLETEHEVLLAADHVEQRRNHIDVVLLREPDDLLEPFEIFPVGQHGVVGRNRRHRVARLDVPRRLAVDREGDPDHIHVPLRQAPKKRLVEKSRFRRDADRGIDSAQPEFRPRFAGFGGRQHGSRREQEGRSHAGHHRFHAHTVFCFR